MKFLAAFKVKCFTCVSLLHFAPSLGISYKACPPKVFPRSAHVCTYDKNSLNKTLAGSYFREKNIAFNLTLFCS